MIVVSCAIIWMIILRLPQNENPCSLRGKVTLAQAAMHPVLRFDPVNIVLPMPREGFDSFIYLAFHIIHTDVEPVIKGSMQQHLFTTQNNKMYPQLTVN